MHAFRVFVLAVVAGAAAASPALADIPIPGQRDIEHTFEIVGLERAPEETIFVVGPLHLGMGHEIVGPGDRFTYRSKYASPNLYAVTADPLPEEFDFKELDASDAPRAVGPFPVTNRVATGSAIDAIHSVYEFMGIEGRTINLRHVRTTRRDRQGGPVDESGWSWRPMALSAAALVGLIGMMLMRRRRDSEAAGE